MRSPFSRGGLLAAAVFLALPGMARACPVCFGAAGSQSTEALGIAILFLLGVLGVVLGGIVGFIIFLARRSPIPPEDLQLSAGAPRG